MIQWGITIEIQHMLEFYGLKPLNLFNDIYTLIRTMFEIITELILITKLNTIKYENEIPESK